MAKKQWTPAQKDAISARGGTVLVSAAAGSGKTAVLIERIMGRILDCLLYTSDAADEMRAV